jgi:hypothetical protein
LGVRRLGWGEARNPTFYGALGVGYTLTR